MLGRKRYEILKTFQPDNGIRYYTIPVEGGAIKVMGLEFLQDACVEEGSPVDGCVAVAHISLEGILHIYHMTAEAMRFYTEFPEGLELEPGVCVHVNRVSSSEMLFADPDWRNTQGGLS